MFDRPAETNSEDDDSMSSSPSSHTSDDDDDDDYSVASSSTDNSSVATLRSSSSSSWITSIAIFGDSGLAVFGSLIVWLLAVGIALRMDSSDGSASRNIPQEFQEEYKQLGPIPQIGPPTIYQVSTVIDISNNNNNPPARIITPEMKQTFEKDGVIAIRGLISKDLLDRLDVASYPLTRQEKPKETIITGRKKPPSQFHTVQEGAIFFNLTSSNGEDKSNASSSSSLPPFYEVALKSEIPLVAAELLGYDSESDDNKNRKEKLRVLRDIFLTKDEEEYVCGWHVDDTGFWPAQANHEGINAWIALDDMPADNGGGFAVAVGSHIASWKNDAYQVTGSTHTFPIEGFKSASDLLDNRVGNGTCNIETSAPHVHQRMEETKRIYDVKKGDIIFHTRWLFHRTVPFERSVVIQRRRNLNSKPLVYRRYSIRYGPGSSVIPPGFGMEPSVLWDEQNGGRTADEVAQMDAAWYPMAWSSPSGEEEEENRTTTTTTTTRKEYQQMQMIAQERFPQVTEKSKQIRKHLQRQRSDKQRQRYSRTAH